MSTRNGAQQFDSPHPTNIIDYPRPTVAGTTRDPQCSPVPVAALLPADSPRLSGADAVHVARLAETESPLPPILVNRATMQVVDGTHRLLAAALRGQSVIDVEFFDGTAEDAFLRAVEVNVTHGLPL